MSVLVVGCPIMEVRVTLAHFALHLARFDESLSDKPKACPRDGHGRPEPPKQPREHGLEARI
jgi:hypothetical protein